jgi:hypothetical protein
MGIFTNCSFAKQGNCFYPMEDKKHPTAGRHHLFLPVTGCFQGAENTHHMELKLDQEKTLDT